MGQGSDSKPPLTPRKAHSSPSPIPRPGSTWLAQQSRSSRWIPGPGNKHVMLYEAWVVVSKPRDKSTKSLWASKLSLTAAPCRLQWGSWLPRLICCLKQFLFMRIQGTTTHRGRSDEKKSSPKDTDPTPPALLQTFGIGDTPLPPKQSAKVWVTGTHCLTRKGTCL